MHVTIHRQLLVQGSIEVFLFFLIRGGKLKVPEWVDLVKTAKSRELAPYDPDWYFIRAGESTLTLCVWSQILFWRVICLKCPRYQGVHFAVVSK